MTELLPTASLQAASALGRILLRWSSHFLKCCRSRPVVISFLCGAALSVAAWLIVDRYWDRQAEQSELAALGDARRILIQEGLADIEQSTNIMSVYLGSSDDMVSRQEFALMSNGLIRRVLDWGQIAWVPRVTRDQRAAHEQAAIDDGLTDYRIKTRAAGAAAPNEDEYFPVFYSVGNADVALDPGFDISSDPVLRDAIGRARDSGRPVAVPMLRGSAQGGSFAMTLSPVYKFASHRDTIADRREQFAGLILGRFSPELALRSILRAVTSPRGIDIQFFAGDATAADLPFFVRSSLLRTAPASPELLRNLENGLHWSGDLTLEGARWKMVAVPIPSAPLTTQHRRAWFVLLASLAGTLAVTGYVHTLVRQRQSVEDALGEASNARSLLETEAESRRRAMTQLSFSNTLLSTAMESSLDGILVVDQAARILSYNKRFVQMWNIPQELVDATLDRPVLDAVLAQVNDRASFLARVQYLYAHPDEAGHERIDLKDGRIFYRDTQSLHDLDRNYLGRIWFFRDITGRHKAAEATEYRGRLLHALASAATELLTTSSLDQAIPDALAMIGEAVGVDRVLVLEAHDVAESGAQLALRYGWHSATAPVILDKGTFAQTAKPGLDQDPWFAPLLLGKPVMSRIRQTSGAVRELLESLQIKSILVEPIMIDGTYWGQIGFDDCIDEREWTPVEIDILRALAELVGSSIVRARHVKQISDANTILQNTPTILFRLRGEPALPMTYISQNISLFGYEPAQMVGSPSFYKSLVHPADLLQLNEAIAALLTDSPPALIEFRLRTRGGDYRWIEARCSQVRDADHQLKEIEGILIDITEHKRAEERIALLARTDALTGLANRATFMERLNQTFAAARRGAPSFAVLFLDVDHFKDINDTLGHATGDSLLRTVAERLKGNNREVDVVARLGGDEFAIIAANVRETSDAGELAGRIRRSLALPCQIDGNEVHVTASIGIAIYTKEIADPDAMLAQADLALYRAKEEGRDQYRFHSEELDDEVRTRVGVADELRSALERGEFELHYQPQIDFSSGAIQGMEALIRWNHPTRGVLKPGSFLPIAEKSGAIIAIGQWVLDSACKQMSSWRKRDIAPPSIAVNVSLAQLKTGSELVQNVADALARWDLQPAELELDITEAIMARTTLAHNETLDRLRELGVELALDDFGTQFSSLDYLRRYSVKRLKIPQSLIEAARRDRASTAMVRAIIGIANELGIEIVAQGVETEAQWSDLTKRAPHAKVQSYYSGEPVPAERATLLLQQGPMQGSRLSETPAARPASTAA